MRDWLDDKLNERMQGLGNNLDLDAAWADLEAKRSQKSKRRSPFFWWILLGGFSSGLVAGEWQPNGSVPVIAQEYNQSSASDLASSTQISPTARDAQTPGTLLARVDQSIVEIESNQGSASENPKNTRLLERNTSLRSPVSTAKRPTLRSMSVVTPFIPVRPILHSSTFSVPSSLDMMPLVAELPSLRTEPLEWSNRLEQSTAMLPPNASSWRLMLRGHYGILSQSGLASALPVDAFGGSLQLRYTLKPWLWLEAGLAYQQLNSQINYEQALVEFQTLENEIIAYVAYADGTVEEQRGDVTATVTTFESFDGWQKHRLYSVPLQVGIGLPLPTNTTLGLYLGGSYGVVANHGGFGIDPGVDQRVLLEDLDLRNNHLLQWQTSLFVEQAIGKRWSLQVAFGRQQAVGNWGLGFSPQSWNGQLGIIRTLSK